MFNTTNRIYPFYIFVDFVIFSISFYVPYFVRFNGYQIFDHVLRLPNFYEYLFIYLIWSLLLFLSLRSRNLFSTNRRLSIPREVLSVSLCVFYTSALIVFIIFLLNFKFISRLIFLSNIFLLVVLLSSWRIVKRLFLMMLISQGFHNINILVIGVSPVARILLEEIKRAPWLGFKIVGFLDDDSRDSVEGYPVLGEFRDFDVVLKKMFIDEVIFIKSPEKVIFEHMIRLCKESRVGIRLVPNQPLEFLPLLDVSYFGALPLLTYKTGGLHPSSVFAKRFLDFVISFLALFFLLPFFIVIALLIKINSAGPVFYVQNRVGYKGREFLLLKFRSMIDRADDLKKELLSKNEVKDGVIFKIKQDPRVTSIGRFLRRFSLDELPQLINVLRGDMSLVGPRPPTPDEVLKYKDKDMERLTIKPGITGLAQVKGRSNLSFYQWVKWDAWYINNWSLVLDFKILMMTVPTVFSGRGAY